MIRQVINTNRKAPEILVIVIIVISHSNPIYFCIQYSYHRLIFDGKIKILKKKEKKLYYCHDVPEKIMAIVLYSKNYGMLFFVHVMSAHTMYVQVYIFPLLLSI